MQHKPDGAHYIRVSYFALSHYVNHHLTHAHLLHFQTKNFYIQVLKCTRTKKFDYLKNILKENMIKVLCQSEII